MDILIFLCVLVTFLVVSDAGGHGGKHHVHVKIHLPEFIHHDHHKKVITIHHHHHKPKKEHYKPHIPHGHHYHHHKKTSTHSVSKGHSNHKTHGHETHGHHGHSHGHHGHHHGHHGHKTHDTPLVYDPPTVNYAPAVTNYEPPSFEYTPPSYDHDYSYKSSVPSIPDSPRVHGVVHTVKQVKVFDSLPNALPNVNTGNAYEVTEEGNEDDDFFTSGNGQESFPAIYGSVKNAAPEGDTLSVIPQQNAAQNNPFGNAVQPMSYANLESFISEQAAPQGGASHGNALHDVASTFDDFTNGIGSEIGSRALISTSVGYQDTPVSFSRQGGIQEITDTVAFQSGSYSN